MSEQGIVVVGASGHARVLIDAIRLLPQFRLVGVVAATPPPDPVAPGVSWLGTPEELPLLVERERIQTFVVAIGENSVRQHVHEEVLRLSPQLSPATVVHPGAWVASTSQLEPGSFVAAGAVVGPAATLGAGAIVNTGATLDHDCRMGAFSSLGPGAHVGGDVTIGAQVTVGIGACISHGLQLGDFSVLGAGAALVHDLPAKSVAMGVPARVRRTREPGDKVL